MRKFIVNLFSNRFGIVLAALNLCYLANQIYGKIDFVPTAFAKFFFIINLPAAFSSYFFYQIISVFFSKFEYRSEVNFKLAFFGVFIVFQWLFIAWIARIITQKLRPKEF